MNRSRLQTALSAVAAEDGELVTEAFRWLEESETTAQSPTDRSGPLLGFGAVPHAFIDEVNLRALLLPTRQAYEVGTGLTEDGRLQDASQHWRPFREHRLFLEQLARQHHVDEAMAVVVDQSIRMKMARGHRFVMVQSTTSVEFTSVAEGATTIPYLCDERHYREHRFGKAPHVVPIVMKHSKHSEE
ncbi:Hypothetical protein UVM_LOCUS387 [uncultured virus]|nr:Hypothetical protein UVM_LOCUS387 [uncultured virus]